MTDELFERGLQMRRRVLGDAYVDRALANADGFTAVVGYSRGYASASS